MTAAPRKRLAAVVLNYRTPDLSIECIRSLHDQIDEELDCIVVVDNASGDDSVARIGDAASQHGWQIEWVEAPRNDGFSAGINLGLAAVDASLYLLCNSDSQLAPGALDALLRNAAARPNAALLGPRIEDREGRVRMSAFRNPRPFAELLEAADLGPLRRAFASSDTLLPIPAALCEVEWLSFACILLRGDAHAALGPLDDGYFMYFEDVDYCRRARAAGWQIVYAPEAIVRHDEGGSSADAPGRVRHAHYEASRRRYYLRYHGAAGALMADAFRGLGRGLRALAGRGAARG